MKIAEAKKIVEDYVTKKSYKKSHAIHGFPVKDGFVFALKPDDWDDKQTLLDPFFKVNSKGEVSEYSPVMNPKEFSEGIKERVEFK